MVEDSSLYMIFYIVTSLLATMSALIGGLSRDVVFSFYVAGVLMSFNAVWATYRFVWRKEDYCAFIVYVGWFIWYHLQVINPVTTDAQIESMFSYGDGARIWGLVLGSLTPLALHVFSRLWVKLFNGRIDALIERSAFHEKMVYKYAAVGFSVLFLMVFSIYAVTGKVVVGSLITIRNMRSEGELAFNSISGAFGSASALTLVALSLVPGILLLIRTQYRIYVYAIFPLVLVWVAGLALSGTRTFLVALMICIAVFFIMRMKISGLKLLWLSMLFGLILCVAQIMSVFRSVGWREFNFSEFSQYALDLQGLETLADQTRSIYFYTESPSNRWFDVDPLSGFVVGLVHRPLEYSYFLIPRSVWHSKPIDPTFTEFTRFSLIMMGMGNVTYVDINDGKDTGFGTSNTTGFLGRDIIRYGPLGAVSICIWFSLFLALAGIAARHATKSSACACVAAGMAGTFFAMWRGPEPMWALLLMPGVFIISVSMYLASRRPIPAFKRN